MIATDVSLDLRSEAIKFFGVVGYERTSTVRRLGATP